MVTKAKLDTEVEEPGVESREKAKTFEMIKMLKPQEYLTGTKLLFTQFGGLFLKRFHHSKRCVASFFLQLILPLLLVVAVVTIGNSLNGNHSMQYSTNSVKMSLTEIYKKTNVLYYGENVKIGALFKSEIVEQGGTLVEVNDIQQKILEIADSSIFNYKYAYPIGAKISKTSSGTHLTALYNAFNPYGSFISTNLIDNAVLQSVHRGKTIETFSHPFPSLFQNSNFTIAPILIMIFMSMAMSFMSSNCIMFLGTERVNKSKHLQLMTGVHPLLYWLSQFVWDMLVCMFVSLICCLIFIYGSDIGISSASRGNL